MEKRPMQSPLVTIGIPAVKGKYFKDALECWKKQTYQKFEVFVQDDASPDDLRSVFDEVCGSDSRFHYERNEKNTAPYFVENWMKTLNKATGEFFVLGSDDDLYEPKYLEEMVALAQKYPYVDFFDCSHDLFNDNGPIMIAPLAPELQSQIDWIYALVYMSRGVVAQSVMCRTAALRNIGGFDNFPAAWGACDWLTWCKMAKNGAVMSPHILMHWRGDGGNTTSSVNRYWVQQKMEAIHLARTPWRQVAESLVPQTPVERLKCAYIKRIMSDKYFDWYPSGTISVLPFDMYVIEMKRQWREGDISLDIMVARIFQRLKHEIIRPYSKRFLRILFYPLVVITRPLRYRK